MVNNFTFEDFVVNFKNIKKYDIEKENDTLKNIIYGVLSTIPNLSFEEINFLTSNNFLDESDANKLLSVVRENNSLIDNETKFRKNIILEKCNICLALEKDYELFSELADIEEKRTNIINKINTKYSDESKNIISNFILALRNSGNTHAINISKKIDKYI